MHQLFLGIHQHITWRAYAKAAQPLAPNFYFSQTSRESLQHAGLGKEGQSDAEDIHCFAQVHSFPLNLLHSSTLPHSVTAVFFVTANDAPNLDS